MMKKKKEQLPKPTKEIDSLQAMKERKSIRSYQRRKLDTKHESLVRKLIKETAKENESVRIVFLKKELCCTFVSDCLQFLVAIVDKESKDENFIDAGRRLHAIIVELVKRNISTCFVGGFRKDEVSTSIPNFDSTKCRIVIVVAVGYKSSYLPLMVRWVMNKSRTRPPFDELFHENRLGTPLNLANLSSPHMKDVLEAVRWSPSSSNKQSLMIVKQNNLFHFYKSGTRAFDTYSLLGIGIGMKTFELACQHFGIAGQFIHSDPELKDCRNREKSSLQYMSTWRGAGPSPPKVIGILKFDNDVMTEESISKHIMPHLSSHIQFIYRTMGAYTGSLSNSQNLSRLLANIASAVATFPKTLDAISISCMSLGAVCEPEQVVYNEVIRKILPEVKCTMPATAALQAFSVMGAKRISLVTPYKKEVTRTVASFFEDNGLEVVESWGFGESTGAGYSNIQPARIVERTVQVYERNEEVDALYLSCTALDVMGVVEEIEERTGVWVVASNQAQVWSTLKLVGYRKPVRKCGRLLREML